MVFAKILVANRGEIARRIMRTCRQMGIGTTAVYSEADFRSPHVQEADEAVFIGTAPAQGSYLCREKILAVAQSRGCQAVHPGYGFLSENAEFARMTEEAGLVFIGPPASAIAMLGDKLASKALALRIGLPIVPGHPEPLSDPADAIRIASRIGFPLLLKPAAGGGGRGMRIVAALEELLPALATCQEETRKSFADGRIFMERFIPGARHIEFQILADRYGHVIHLGERECSIQRRYQKVIEETPSPAVDEPLRQKMGALACALAHEAKYSSAGTVEFIVDRERNFYFLEMNTRLQVEHPVTELVTGLDLVELQIRIAAGEALPLKQEEVSLYGWAIEARICAEDPARGFSPTTGMITRYAPPRGKNVRVESGVEAGSVIPIYYDSMLAKVATWGESREQARQTLLNALNGYHIEGLITNVDFANAIIDHPAFARADLSTDFIEKHFAEGKNLHPPDPEKIHCMVMAGVLTYHTRQNLVRESLKAMAARVGEIPPARKESGYIVKVGEEVFEVWLEPEPAPRRWNIRVNGSSYEVVTPEFEYYRRRLRLAINGASHMFRLQYHENHIQACFCGLIRTLEIYTPREWKLVGYMPAAKKEVPQNILKCPMPGLVIAVSVAEGEYVRRGQELLRLESMKIESGIASPRDARVEKILVRPGQEVASDEPLLIFQLSS